MDEIVSLYSSPMRLLIGKSFVPCGVAPIFTMLFLMHLVVGWHLAWFMLLTGLILVHKLTFQMSQAVLSQGG